MTKKPTSAKDKDRFNMQDIKDLIAILRRNNVWEFSLDQNGVKIHVVTGQSDKARGHGDIKEHRTLHPVATHAYSPVVSMAPPAPPVGAYSLPAANSGAGELAAPNSKAAGDAESVTAQEEIEENMIIIKSPMVGTFYRAPAPDSPPYVEIDDPVRDDTVLCIIEAMKLMNELKAECSGKVTKILVENGQPVEYGQHLFLIEPA